MQINSKSPQLKSHKEVIECLDNILKQTQKLGMNETPSFKVKIDCIKQLRKYMDRRDLPLLTSNEDWVYQIQYTMSALYLNLIYTTKKQTEFPRRYGYNLIRLAGKYLTINKYAELRGSTIATVRAQLRAGQFPYAEKSGFSWLIPEFSHPLKGNRLDGQFEILEDIESYRAPSGITIPLLKDSAIKIRPNGRNSENKKIFSIEIDFDRYSPLQNNGSSYLLTNTEKQGFLFYLISNPMAKYHSADIGLAEWLYE